MEKSLIGGILVSTILFLVVTGIVFWVTRHTGSKSSNKSNFCFESEKDVADYEAHPKLNYECISDLDPTQEFIQSTSPEFQARGIPFPNLGSLPPSQGWQQEYLYSQPPNPAGECPPGGNCSCIGKTEMGCQSSCGIYN